MVLHYREYGDKSVPLILFLHGGGVSSWMWDKQIQYFTHYHCIVPDLPEHGVNNYRGNFSIKGSAEELIKLIEEIANGKKVILIGFSLGAQIIIQILSMKPDLIDFAIINSALVRPILYAKKLIQPSIGLTFPLIKNRWFSKLQAKTLYISEDYFEKYYEESCQMKHDTLVRVLEENMSFRIPKDFRKANGKILVTVGEREKSVMKKSAKDIVEANSNCIGVIIPKIGHGVPLATPEFFNHMVETWIHEGNLPKECKEIN
ncbi:alpha/beta hydrolase [Tissierella sp. MSJ-40]|uniref:Alpha/beta hydrolase n=1 Tax=Tissierella simiarum TaxID=2841534 RepID=A0ABS6E6N7_9FIRM|nr:alpha/beta hydrolase [Tissierella simiarum]MBU5438588.1 alpha/beta hydrolase [Tissierella simiarum]